MQHKLKILPQYFKSSKDGSKPFEIRKNDRDYKVGDTLLLQEYKEDGAIYGNKENDSEIEFDIGYTGQEITKEITYILEGGQYGLEEGYCILGLKQEGIKLQNIDLTGIITMEQLQKVYEEEKEFEEAFYKYDKDKTEKNKSHLIEELLDEFQSKLGLLEKEGITAIEVMKEYPKHLKKLESRPREKKCSKCINSCGCCLYQSEHWDGQQEAESCKTYKEGEKQQ